MRTRCTRLPIVAVALAPLLLPACRRSHHVIDDPPPVSSPGPFRVSSVELGSAIDSVKHVSAPGAAFEPEDTIYASILTEGAAPQVTLGARWTYEDGELVSEETRVIMPNGPTATEFHVAKPYGWALGHYKVEVTADGVNAVTRDFEVK